MDDSDQNKYNHNFSGTYCVCKRPYPDPDDNIPDEMIQCVICEDWYHVRHLEGKVPDTNDFDEMICQLCTKQHEFLNHYSHLSIMPRDDDHSTVSELNVTQIVSTEEQPSANGKVNGAADASSKAEPDASVNSGPSSESADGEPITSATTDNGTQSKSDGSAGPKVVDGEAKEDILDDELNQCIRDIIEINKSNLQPEIGPSVGPVDDGPPAKKRKCDDTMEASTSAGSSSASVCRKPKVVLHKFNGASFWTNDWRNALCQCVECTQMYQRGDIEFITDNEDTVQYYMEQGKAKGRISSEEMLMSTISNMDHVGQIEAITCYNKLKSKLTDFLASFVTKDKVITETDVKNFFQSNDDKNN